MEDPVTTDSKGAIHAHVLELIEKMEVQGLVSDYLEADSYLVMITDPDQPLGSNLGLSFGGPFDDLDKAWDYGQMLLEQVNRGQIEGETPFEMFVMPCFAPDLETFEKWKDKTDG